MTYALFRQLARRSLAQRNEAGMLDPDIYVTELLHRAKLMILRSEETVRRSHEVLRVCREVQLDRERAKILKP